MNSNPVTLPNEAPSRTGRTIAIITGLKPGDPNQLATQPMALVSIAYELGRTDRKTFLAEAAKIVQTAQPIGQLFSFHKQALITGGFIGFEKVPRSQWLAECAAKSATLGVQQTSA